MAAAAWSAIIRSQPMQSVPMAPRANTARTPRTCPRWTSGCPAKPRMPSARAHSGRAIQSGNGSPRSGTSIGSPLAAIRPTLRAPNGKRRNAPSSRVHSVDGVTADRPPLATRYRQRDWPRHCSTVGQSEQSAVGCASQIRTRATRGESPTRPAMSRSNSGSDCSWAMSRSSRLGAANRGAGSRCSAMPTILRVFGTTRRDFVKSRNLVIKK